ncbi:Serpin (serine protease inhibitor) [Clostridiales bacterium CHKCI001]|nr:Serpin (serine protease inhibitor) [Clostridiales bacterium CHKCI001]
MKKRILVLLCIGAMLIGGCGGIGLNPSEANIQKNEVVTVAEAKKPDYIMHEKGMDSEEIYWDGNSVDWSQYQLDQAFQNALVQFAAKTTAKVMERNNENLCYSPISLYYALSLAAIGSSGQTEQELLTLLGVENREVLKDQCDKLYHILYTDTNESVIQLANSIWKAYDEGEEAIALKETYIKDASEQLFSSIYEVKRIEAEDRIAQWISKQTNGFLNPTSSKKPVEWDLALINAVYYRDQWVNRFPEQLTEEGEFTKADQSKVKCSFMNTENQANVKETDQFLQASLQLKDSEMFFVLPKPGIDVHQLIKSEETLNQILTEDGETRCQVIWRVPKFNYETSIENLDQVVKELGVVSAFERSDGFENMTDTEMYIDKIIQKSKIMIDEKGVEAAAYTEIMMDEEAALTEQTVSMNLDHPFIYGIKKNGNCLFIGICEQP